MPKFRRTAVALSTCVVVVGVAGVGVAVSATRPSDPVAVAATPGGVVSVVAGRSDQEKVRDLDRLPPQQRAGFQKWQDDILADHIPVADEAGLRGYISKAAYDSRDTKSVTDLFRVVDDAGNLVGYWGGGIGFIEKQLVESPSPIDFQAMKADRLAKHSGPPASIPSGPPVISG